MSELFPVITIDGPGGAGKGTVTHLLAKALNWHFLDSGAIYRVLALAVLQQHLLLDDELALTKLAEELEVKFINPVSDLPTQVILASQDVTEAIRSEQCGNVASKISVFPSVRAALLARQRAFCQPPGLITDGRDMGTVVFPDALLKFYLHASREERAKRRWRQLQARGINVNLAAILRDLAERDARDEVRDTAPLRPAADAIVIDTTNIDSAAVFKLIMDKIKTVLI